MRVIAYTSEYQDNRVLIKESTGETCHSDKLEELLGFLVSPLDEPHQKIVWELADFTAPLFRLLSDNSIDRLAKEHKLWLGRYSIYYRAEKVFTINCGRLRASFYEMAQFYPDIDNPEDSLEIANYGVDLLTNLQKIGLHIREGDRLTSPAAILEDKLMNDLDLPTDKDVPDEAAQCAAYAYATCGRLWICALKIGHWEQGQIWNYDLSGAFAAEAARLYDFRGAKFEYSKLPVIGADMGWMRGFVTIDPSCQVSPIMLKIDDGTEEGTWANPTGTFETILSLDEARFISKYRLGHFKLVDGWFVFLDKKVRPLENVIKGLYQLRMQTPALGSFLKQATLGCFYGKTLEEYKDGGVGRHFNPIWGSLISNRARLRVAQFIIENGLSDSVVHVSVDGFLSERKVDIPNTPGLGQWRVEAPEGVIVYSSGLVFLKTNHRQTKPKGITYDKLISMIQTHPRITRYEVLLPRRVTLGEAAGRRYDELGDIRDFHSSIDLILQRHNDRNFKKLPRTGEGLLNRYESEPIRL